MAEDYLPQIWDNALMPWWANPEFEFDAIRRSQLVDAFELRFTMAFAIEIMAV